MRKSARGEGKGMGRRRKSGNVISTTMSSSVVESLCSQEEQGNWIRCGLGASSIGRASRSLFVLSQHSHFTTTGNLLERM
jgi:hypothetical protein